MDPKSSRRPVPDFLAEIEMGIDGMRLAVPNNYFYDPVKPEIRDILEESINVYRSLGAEITKTSDLKSSVRSWIGPTTALARNLSG